MKYGAKQEQSLMKDIWSPHISDNPYNFVKYAFEWGKKDTPLEDFDGPRKWQRKNFKKYTYLSCKLLCQTAIPRSIQ